MKIFIRYGYNYFDIEEADTFKECMVKFAKETGIYCELFEKALVGCTSETDCIEMFEQFSDDKINAVYTIQETIYEE